MHTLSKEEIQVINVLEKNTGARASDAVMTEKAVVFLVDRQDLGKAIGKGGANIARLKKFFGRDVDVIVFSSDLKEFLKNVFYPAEIKQFSLNEVDGRKKIVLQVDSRSKGLAIGRGGEKIERARMLVKRYFDVEELRIL